MIDKTIPYFNIIMKYEGPAVTDMPRAPKGYVFRGYQEGDEEIWAEMEVSNKDFDTYENAVTYFKKKYCIEMDKLKDRFVGIIEAASGKLCGSVICWDDIKGEKTVSSVHWLITDPSKQGLGLGKALVKMLLYKFSVKNELPIYLHTQPWSYNAIGIYSKMGFQLLLEDSFRGYENQSKQALPVLKTLMTEHSYKKLVCEMK